MSILSHLFGGGKNPRDAATGYLDQIPGLGHQSYDTYITEGKDAGGRTKSAYEGLMDDPAAFINKLMEGYNTSEGYNFQKDLLTKEMSNTAAAGGIAGTPIDQLNQGEAVQGLLSKDMQEYLKNVLGVFNTGLKGEAGIATRGYDATGKLTDILGNNLTNQAGLAYKDQVDQNQNRTDLFNALAKLLGGGLDFATKPKLSLFGNNIWGGKNGN